MLKWMSVLGQLAAAMATVAAVVVALWVAVRDGRRQRAEQADREAAQARLVTAEVHRAEGQWWVRITNHSTAPVFDVDVEEIRHPDGTARVAPSPGSPAELGKLAAGETIDQLVVSEGSSGNPSAGVVVLRFIDAAGLRWRREGPQPPQRILQ